MAQATISKQANKPAAKQASKATAKPASKPAAKQEAKQEAKPMLYAALLSEALAGKFGAKIAQYYRSAASNHKKVGTIFPRTYKGEQPVLLKIEEAREWIEKRAVCGIASGERTGQRIYDEMRVEAAKLEAAK